MEVVFSSLTASSIKSDQVTSNSQQIADLYQYICMAAPFGTPTDTNPSNLKLQLQFRKAMSMPKEKVYEGLWSGFYVSCRFLHGDLLCIRDLLDFSCESGKKCEPYRLVGVFMGGVIFFSGSMTAQMLAIPGKFMDHCFAK